MKGEKKLTMICVPVPYFLSLQSSNLKTRFMELNEIIVIYQTSDGNTSIDVKLENETVWLT